MDKKYYGVLAFDAFWMALAYLWIAEGKDWAGNVFVFLIWFFGVLSILSGIVLDKSMIKVQRPKHFYIWHAMTDLTIVTICAAQEHFWLAGVYAIGHYFMEAARQREPKSKKD